MKKEIEIQRKDLARNNKVIFRTIVFNILIRLRHKWQTMRQADFLPRTVPPQHFKWIFFSLTWLKWLSTNQRYRMPHFVKCQAKSYIIVSFTDTALFIFLVSDVYIIGLITSTFIKYLPSFTDERYQGINNSITALYSI